LKNLSAPDLKKFTNYEYKFDLKGDTSAAAIVRFVAPKSRVLDIGAGSGSITRQLVKMKNCDVVAVENNPLAVKKLLQFCNKVHALDLNDENWAEEVVQRQRKLGLPTTFDYVIAGDVLEHLYDPWTTAKNMASLINDTGKVIILVPHAGHSTVVAAFYDSNVDWQESGILDKTHIRFFGLRNIDVLHAHADLAITRVHEVIRRPEITEFADKWQTLPEQVRQVLAARECANIYQLVTEAGKSAFVKEPIVVSASANNVSANLPGAGFWRRLFGGS